MQYNQQILRSALGAALVLTAAGATTPCRAGVVRSGGPAHPADNRASVIVQLDGPLSPARSRALDALGADVYRDLPLIHSVALTIPASRQQPLAALPFVRNVSPDMGVHKTDAFTCASSLGQAAFAATGLDGTGVTVAVVDSGISQVPDLNTADQSASRVVASAAYGPANATDTLGHGTHVAGIIAGNGAMSIGKHFTQTFYGVAPNVNLLNVAVLDDTGSGTVSNVIAGIEYVVSNREKYNVRVLNLSLGHPVTQSYATDPLNAAVEAAWKAGIVVVCAAGNDGRASSTLTDGANNEGYGTSYGSIECPGNDPYVITVGATKSTDSNRADDRIATYSSRGPTRFDHLLKPDIIC